MVSGLVKEEQPDLLWIGLSLAGRVFTKAGDLEWLRRRKAMLNDFLRDSPIYQDVMADARDKAAAEAMKEIEEVRAKAMKEIEEARAKAAAKAMKEIEEARAKAAAALQEDVAREFLAMITDHFPALEVLAKNCVNCAKTTHAALVHLLGQACLSHTEQQAREVLEAYLNIS
jgi:hypothetical protein